MAFFGHRARIFRMISLADARALIAKHISPSRPAAVPLTAALGRVLRQSVAAREDFPAFDRSAMDGYALIADDPSEHFRVIGEIQPGAVPKLKVRPGECARIFTGARIPAGATRVVMQEDVRLDGNSITLLKRDRQPNIRYRGEDARKGEVLLQPGSRIGIGEVSLLASLGVTQPKVSPLVRVAHFATGNELIAPDQKPKPGQIRDSNSSLVAAFVQQFGGEMVHQERLVDDFDLLLRKTRKLGNSFDLLLLSGGASVGEYDFGKKLLKTLGFKTHFTAINLRPGKPLVFATRGRTAAFIVPGNPVSHFVTLHVAVRLTLEQFSGITGPLPLVKMRLGENFEAKPGARETFWPAHAQIQNGGLVAHPLRWQSSGDVTGLAGANALMQLPAGAKPPPLGEDVSVLML